MSHGRPRTHKGSHRDDSLIWETCPSVTRADHGIPAGQPQCSLACHTHTLTRNAHRYVGLRAVTRARYSLKFKLKRWGQTWTSSGERLATRLCSSSSGGRGKRRVAHATRATRQSPQIFSVHNRRPAVASQAVRPFERKCTPRPMRNTQWLRTVFVSQNSSDYRRATICYHK